MKIKDIRFNELVSRLLSDELSADESAELIQSVKSDTARLQEVRAQLEVSEMIALTVDTRRDSKPFLSSLREQIDPKDKKTTLLENNMSAKNIGKYTLDDALRILEKARHTLPPEEKPYDLATGYVKWVTENYWHRYDKVNLGIATNAQRYISRLRAKQTRPKAMDNLIEERDALIGDCEANRAELGLSVIKFESMSDEDATKGRNKYCLEINDERDIEIALEFEEVRNIGGSSQSEVAEQAYPVINVQDWFEGGHTDRNITQQDLDTWTDELVTLLEEPTAYIAMLAMRTEKEVIARQATCDAVKEFKEDWQEKRAEIEKYKHNILSAQLLQRQISNIRQMVHDLIEDLTGPVITMEPTTTRLGPVDRLGPDRIIDQEAKPLPEEDEEE